MRLHNRQIRAEFWTDEGLLELSRDQRGFYMGLMQLADDSGCVERSAHLFKIHLYPSERDGDITKAVLAAWTETLVGAGLLIPYETQGTACLYVALFHKWQILDNPAGPSRDSVPLPSWIAFHRGESRKTCRYIVSCPGHVRDTSGTGGGQVPDVSPLELEQEPEGGTPSGTNTSAVGIHPAPTGVPEASSPVVKVDLEQFLHSALGEGTRWPAVRAVTLELVDAWKRPIWPASVGWDHTAKFTQQEPVLARLIADAGTIAGDWRAWLRPLLTTGKLQGVFEQAAERSDLQVWQSVVTELSFAARLAGEKAAAKVARSGTGTPPGGGATAGETAAVDALG